MRANLIIDVGRYYKGKRSYSGNLCKRLKTVPLTTFLNFQRNNIRFSIIIVYLGINFYLTLNFIIMKKITFLLAALFLSVAVNAQLVEVAADFEDSALPTGWTSVVNTGDCDWSFGMDAPNGFSFTSIGIYFDDDGCGNGAPASNVSLFTEEYDISNADGTLDWSYDYFYDALNDTSTDFMSHSASIDGGATWIEVANYSGADVPLENAVFANPVVPGQFPSIQFRWDYDDGDAWAWGGGIDNFAFSYTNILGVSDDAVEGFTFAPNPAQDFITLTAPNTIGRVSLVNVLGQTVITTEINATSSDLDISGLAAGTYILKVAVGDDAGTYHIIKE